MTFEYQSYPIQVGGLRQVLEPYLREIWLNRSFPYGSDIPGDVERTEENGTFQPFFRFDGDKIFARGYVGFVQVDGHLLEVYPKVFQHAQAPSKALMLKHLFFWFRYCRKILVPFSQTEIDSFQEENVPELLIYLFARQCHETIQQSPFSTYEEVYETLNTPRGRIDLPGYVSHGLARGQYYKLACVHEPFVYDNRLNRAIKYVSRILLNKAGFSDTRELLRQIIFILDEVEDIPCGAEVLDTVHLNAFFSDYIPIIDWCRRFLQDQLYSHRPYDLATWSLLLPMEYVFEDFVAGFLERHFSDTWDVHYQRQELYLTNTPEAFQMRHDIFLTHRTTKETIIIDTKYKVRQSSNTDPKQGVSQPDMYQVFSYAVRRKCPRVIMFYPNYFEKCHDPFNFYINTGFDGLKQVVITIAEVQFWSLDRFNTIEQKLLTQLDNIINNK